MIKEKIIRIKPTGQYPCQWDDLINKKNKTIATIYTENEAKGDGLKFGITKGKDGVYDIVTSAKEINNEVVRNALKDLSKKTKKKYQFITKQNLEDKLIKYANRLIKPIEKYGNQKKGYDFSKAKTPKQKTEIISIWIGEILYEALTYKDTETVKSLTTTIKTEIKELIKKN